MGMSSLSSLSVLVSVCVSAMTVLGGIGIKTDGRCAKL